MNADRFELARHRPRRHNRGVDHGPEDVVPGPLTCLSSMATKALLGELARLHEERSGLPIAVESVGGVDAARRVRAGEAVDLVVLSGTVMQALEAEGHLLPGSRVPLAVSTTAFAVSAGHAAPDLSTPDRLRQALRDASAVGYSTGPSGDHLIRLVENWGLAAELAGKLVKAAPGVPVGSLVASGQVSIGFQQYSELFEVSGITVITALPPEAAAATVFTGGLSATCTRTEDATAALRAMSSPEVAAVYARCGMSPAPRA